MPSFDAILHVFIAIFITSNFSIYKVIVSVRTKTAAGLVTEFNKCPMELYAVRHLHNCLSASEFFWLETSGATTSWLSKNFALKQDKMTNSYNITKVCTRPGSIFSTKICSGQKVKVNFYLITVCAGEYSRLRLLVKTGFTVNLFIQLRRALFNRFVEWRNFAAKKDQFGW